MCANPLRNPPFSVDALWLAEGPRDLFEGAETTAVSAAAGRAVVLQDEAVCGALTTRAVRADFPFNEAIPSWNGTAGAGAGFRIFARTRPDGGNWSPWLDFGDWGTPAPRNGDRITSFDGGSINVDILFLDPPASEFQFRVELSRETPETPSPAISLLAFASSNTLQDRELWERLTRRPETPPDPPAPPVNIQVPYRSQHWEDRSIARSVCSPTSVAMVMEMLGVRAETAEVARLAFDPHTRIYGNWSRNVQAAAHYGLRGYLDRFRSWDKVRRELEQGHPVIASIRFDREELEDPPYRYTSGHLIVVRGMTADGGIITNDPTLARENRGDGYIWNASDLGTAWFGRGGVGYVITAP